MRKHFTVKVFGKVQGVFFRASAKSEAEKFGLTGFARNEPDGSVYIEAEGKKEKLDKFVSWCKIGPSLAKVKKVEISEDPLKYFKYFSMQ